MPPVPEMAASMEVPPSPAPGKTTDAKLRPGLTISMSVLVGATRRSMNPPSGFRIAAR